MTGSEGCRKVGIADHTCYRWKKEYGELNLDQAKRLKELKAEISPLAPPAPEAGMWPPNPPQMNALHTRNHVAILAH